jgi:CHAT domain-containing protein
LRLVVLSACNTATGNFAKEFATVAQTLVESGIPAVVANQFEIRSEKAALFTSGFYSELVKTGDVDKATTGGRLALKNGTQPVDGVASIDWGIPTLYRHLGGARTF